VGSAVPCDLVGHGKRVWCHTAVYKKPKPPLLIIIFMQIYFWNNQLLRQTLNRSRHSYS